MDKAAGELSCGWLEQIILTFLLWFKMYGAAFVAVYFKVGDRVESNYL